MSEQPPEGQPGQGEADRIQSYDERFGKLEHEQAEQRGLLEQIRDALGGGSSSEGAKHEVAPPAASIADQVRQAVRDVGAEQEQQRRDAEHQAAHDKLTAGDRERPPRESMGRRGRLAEIMYGKEPR